MDGAIIGRDSEGNVHEVVPLPGAQAHPNSGPGATAPGAPAPPAAMSVLDRIRAIQAAALHGAARVYHVITTVEDDVGQWRNSNPAAAALIDAGQALAQQALERWAPGEALLVLAEDVEAALHSLAAADATASSGTSDAKAAAAAVPAPQPAAA